MNAELAIGLIAGFLLGGTISAIWIGTIAHANYEKYRAMVAVAFELEQRCIDLENKAYPEHWVLEAEGGADPVVVRKRPDIVRHEPAFSWKDGPEMWREGEGDTGVFTSTDGTERAVRGGKVVTLGSDEDIPDWEGG